MAKRKKKRRKPKRPDFSKLERAEVLWEEGETEEAIEILEEFVQRWPHNLDGRLFLGSIYAELGDFYEAAYHFESAVGLSPRDPMVHFALGMAYGNLELPSHTILSMRRCLELRPQEEVAQLARTVLSTLEKMVESTAEGFGIPSHRMERAALLMEEGLLANERGDFDAAVNPSKEAARLVPNWATPRNNLALSYFFLGKWDKAVSVEMEVLEKIDSENVHALSNLIRFLCASGRRDEAEGYSIRLGRVKPKEPVDYIKMAEAYAALEQDGKLYAILKKARKAKVGLGPMMLRFLGTAAANLGKRKEAKRYWREALRLDPDAAYLEDLISAISKEITPRRFRYFSPSDMVPRKVLDEFLEKISSPGISDERMEREIRLFVKKYPYIVDFFSEMLWYGDEEWQLGAVNALEVIANERAIEDLRAFALSQEGSDDARMKAAYALLELGIFSEEEPVSIWLEGEWKEVFLRLFTITEEREVEYSEEVLDLLSEATIAFKEGDDERAIEGYEKVIALEPKAKEAYGNLGAVYFRRGEEKKAEEFFEKALEIDPNYVFPRCNLASLRIDQGRLDEALEILSPISFIKTFHPQEFIFYNRICAHLFIARGEYDAAEKHLEAILEFEPEDEFAQEWLPFVKWMLREGKFFARMRERDRRRRERERRKPLKGTDLIACLSRHTKDNLVAMARALEISRPAGIRKAELIELLARELANPDVVRWALEDLAEEEKEALGFVLAEGGMVQYERVSERYGDDLDDHFYWYYHEPETTIGRLRLYGLLFEGGYEDEVVLVVPDELRYILSTLLGLRLTFD